MAITSVGYDGTVDEQDWASLSPASASRPGVVWGAGPQIVGNVDRTVRIAPGKLYGWGVLDYNSANVDLQADPVTSGSRWDTVVLRRDWQPTPGGGSTLMLLKGTSSASYSSQLQNNPGVLADQPLCIVRVQAGLTTIQELIDKREWQQDVSFRATSGLPVSALWAYGDKVLVSPQDGYGIDLAVRRGGDGTEYWDTMLTRPWYNLSLASGYRTQGGQTPQYRVVGDMLQLRGRVERTSGATFDNTYRTVVGVPTNAAPAREAYVPCGSNFSSATGGGGMCNVQTNGVVQINMPANLVSWVSLDGISIPIGA